LQGVIYVRRWANSTANTWLPVPLVRFIPFVAFSACIVQGANR
jgi:hypothetical protein